MRGWARSPEKVGYRSSWASPVIKEKKYRKRVFKEKEMARETE